jgi:hypothetical protein
MPDFLEGLTNPEQQREILKHLEVCKNCAKEKEFYEKSWSLVGSLKDIEPEPGFKTRFWNRLSREEEAKLKRGFDVLGLLQHWQPVALTVATVLILIGIAIPNYLHSKSIDLLASKISDEEIVLAESVDLLSNFEVISDMDFLENMEIIENLDKIQTNAA